MPNFRLSLAGLLGLFFLLVPTLGHSSPWTMPDNQTLLNVGYDFQFATREFVPDGTFQKFPLDGRFLSNSLRVGLRHGLSDQLEFEGVATFKSVSFLADPVILELPEEPNLTNARESIVDFNNAEFGAGDVFLTGRYNFLKKTLALAQELRLKLPTGYQTPQGTFDSETGAVADDVTLGDGQADLETSFLFGLFVAQTRSFVRIDPGFRFRFGGPGHQAIGAVKFGQFIGEQFLLFAGARGAYTVNEGEVIGQTFVSTVFDLSADEIVAGENIEPVDLRLDKDWLMVEGGILFVITRGVEVQAGYSRVIIGRNIPAINTVSVGTSVRMQRLGTEE